ncbi:ribosome-assembly protein 3-domain-containing protein [Rhexocercosporidium sp. MPI-PUGE-AT-0058]|nr:ribosome-assembly protein 3-domain-containing protein [Rhexocercosporidium sp. MPI-PUGE-AT-0058]
MAPKASAKPRRHKKRKSRTEVSSGSSDSEPERKQVKTKKSRSKATGAQDQGERQSSSSAEETTVIAAAASSKEPKNADMEAAFAQFYMQRATAEFADDLERLRTSDDFKDEAVPMLIAALKGGTAMFSMEEKKRIVLAGRRRGIEIGD